MRLDNKVALISGGARGMGAAEARMFAREGAKVVIGDVLDTEGRQVEAEINQAGGECVFLNLDVTQESEWQMAVEAAVTRFGKLDVLVNNAGIIRPGGQAYLIEETSAEEWDLVMNVNAKGVFLGTKAAIPEMRKAGGGSIINISSNSAFVGFPRSASYCSSKAAVRIFTKCTAIEYAKEGIRANSVHPGTIDTAMTQPVWQDDQTREEERVEGSSDLAKYYIDKTPLGRIGTPEDVAYGVLFLASDESSFMTGSELVIDGGYIAQ